MSIITPYDSSQTAALFGCVSSGDMKALEEALKKGADPDASPILHAGDTILEFACRELNAVAVRLLLEKGANPNLGSFKPLCRAAASKDIVVLLLQHGADVNSKNENGHIYQGGGCPLHCAAMCGYADSAEILVAAGADKTARNQHNQTPLEVAKQQLEYLQTNGFGNPPDVELDIQHQLNRIITLLS